MKLESQEFVHTKNLLQGNKLNPPSGYDAMMQMHSISAQC